MRSTDSPPQIADYPAPEYWFLVALIILVAFLLSVLVYFWCRDYQSTDDRSSSDSAGDIEMF